MVCLIESIYKYQGRGGLDIIALSIFSSDAKALRLSAEPFSLFASSNIVKSFTVTSCVGGRACRDLS